MADFDLEQIADAYLVNLANADDRPLDDARYDPLAADTADEHETCSKCGGSGWVIVSEGHAYFPQRKTYRCDCAEPYCKTHDIFNCPYAHGGAR